MRKGFFVILLAIFAISTYLLFIYPDNISEMDIQINDSYLQYQPLIDSASRDDVSFSLSFSDHVKVQMRVHFETDGQAIRIKSIEVIDADKGPFSRAYMNVNTTHSAHDGKEAIRFTINFSYLFQKKWTAGNCIFKLTPSGELIKQSISENISEFEIITID